MLVSVFPDAERARPVSEGFEHYMRAKKTADVHLVRTDLDWLIVRPGVLRDEPGTGRVTAGPAIEYGDVHRDDVAGSLLLRCTSRGSTAPSSKLTSGNTPVAEAVEQLVTANLSRRFGNLANLVRLQILASSLAGAGSCR